MKRVEDELYLFGIIAMIFGIPAMYLYYTLVLNILPYTCILYEKFGIYCPGCGGTRAFIAMLKGHFLQSLWYHPVVLYGTILFSAFMLTQTAERLKIFKIKGIHFHNWYLYGAIFLLVLNCLEKNILKFCFSIEM